jgi:rubrerythrin
MAQNPEQAKEKILSEFETMKSYELSAHELYARIANDPGLDEQKVRDAFVRLAGDEKRHADLVQEIIDITMDAL